MKKASRHSVLMFIILGSVLMINGCDDVSRDPYSSGCSKASTYPHGGKIITILHNKSDKELHMWSYCDNADNGVREKIDPRNKLMPGESRRVTLSAFWNMEASITTLVIKTGQNGVTTGTTLYELTYEEFMSNCGTFRVTYDESGKFKITPNCF